MSAVHRALEQFDVLARVRAIRAPRTWDDHVESVRPAIAELDRLDAVSAARAPGIAVTNATDLATDLARDPL